MGIDIFFLLHSLSSLGGAVSSCFRFLLVALSFKSIIIWIGFLQSFTKNLGVRLNCLQGVTFMLGDCPHQWHNLSGRHSNIISLLQLTWQWDSLQLASITAAYCALMYKSQELYLSLPWELLECPFIILSSAIWELVGTWF